MSPIEAWLNKYINEPNFAEAVEQEIESLDKPADRLKWRFELLSYVVPKVKTVDAVGEAQDRSVTINYMTVGGTDEISSQPPRVSDEVSTKPA